MHVDPDATIEQQLTGITEGNDRRQTRRDDMIVEEAGRMHTAARSLHLLDRPPEVHTCSRACGLVPMDIVVFEGKGVVHVCASTARVTCPISCDFHRTELSGYTVSSPNVAVYACPLSGYIHRCGEVCDQCHVTVEGQKVCPLTALVLGEDPRGDSFDWVSDAVGRGEFVAAKVCSSGGGAKRRRVLLPTVGVKARHFASKQADQMQQALVTIYMAAQSEHGPHPQGDNSWDEVQEALGTVHTHVWRVITQLFPGCEGRRTLARDMRKRQFMDMVSAWRRYAKDSVVFGEGFYIEKLNTRMYEAVGPIILNNPAAWKRTRGPEDAENMARMYAGKVVNMLVTLVSRTAYGDCALDINQFAVAALYVLQDTYMHDGIEIISEDAKLAASLPNTDSLTRLLDYNPQLTNSKAKIQKAIQKAILEKINPMDLLAPPAHLAFTT